MLTFLAIVVSLCGCGGGGGAGDSASSDSALRAAVSNSTVRSVRLHNYNNWKIGNDESPATAARALETLARYDNVKLSEKSDILRIGSGSTTLNPQALKALNPKLRVYRYYILMCKPSWDSDWNNPSDTRYRQCPLSKDQISKNDWWLRDANGDIVKETDDQWLLDVGKPGFKEAYLQATLERSAGKGLDGFVFDYWRPYLDEFVQEHGAVLPLTGYPTSSDWLEKAWKPFVNYVMDGVRSAGYRIIGNCVGEYGNSSARQEFQRSKVDGVVYEQGAVDWTVNGSGWLPGSVIEKRIKSVSEDPLEVWFADGGLRNFVEDYDQKQNVSLAMYYIAIPASYANRSYHHANDWSPYWHPMWDFYIGDPAEPASKLTDQYAWSRKYTNGLVLLNYEASKSVTFTLDQVYHDVNGKQYTDTVTLPPHTALILAVGA
ncbi:MAG: hypothetical protein HYX78_05600 [Armatimonadetes bacterium]|nr:hypothetical protein [Armatimonadota bacterium]